MVFEVFDPDFLDFRTVRGTMVVCPCNDAIFLRLLASRLRLTG